MIAIDFSFKMHNYTSNRPNIGLKIASNEIGYFLKNKKLNYY